MTTTVHDTQWRLSIDDNASWTSQTNWTYTSSSSSSTTPTDLLTSLDDVYSTTSFLPGVTSETEGGLQCPELSVACNETLGAVNYCLHGGKCCWLYVLEKITCRCTTDYIGPRCEYIKPDDFIWEAVESRERALVKAGISSIISLVVGLIALLALLAVLTILIRKRLYAKESLEHHLKEIKVELDRLPSSIDKLAHLTRVTRLLEQEQRETARQTVFCDAAAATAAGDAARGRPVTRQSTVWLQCLPRWSSAPALLIHSTPHDVTDAPFTATEKQRLQQVFSVDESRAPQQHTRL